MAATTATDQDLQSLGYELRMRDRWAKVWASKRDKTIVCSLRSEYVPVEHFMSTFQKISALVQNGPFEKFIFDKRSLRAFHQPSMEWYFAVWKKEMLQHGLTKHRKILPNEEWFRNAVMIARAQLNEKYPELLGNLDIKYCDNLHQALNS